MSKPYILLACASDWQAPARLPRLFRRAGCHVTTFSPRDAGITKTKFIDEVIEAPEEIACFADALRSHVGANRGKYAWIIAIDDPLLAELVARRNEAWVGEILPLDRSTPSVELTANKAKFSELAASLGLPLPPSRACASLEEARLRAPEIGYPLMLKVAESYAGLGVRKVESEEDLVQGWLELKVAEPAVLQKYVVGRLGNSAALFSKGALLCSMSAFKSRTWPGELGPSSARKFMHHDLIEPMLDELGTRSGYDGFAALDWILDESGALHVIELNARPVPALHMGAHVGVDFAIAISDFISARNTGGAGAQQSRRQRPHCSPTNQAIFPMFPEDFYRSITESDFAGLAQFARGGPGFDDIPWDDPLLLVHLLRRRSARRAFDRLFATRSVTLDDFELRQMVHSGRASHGVTP